MHAEGLVVDNRYHLGQVLGTGGMGVVYSALELHTAKRVAVKVLHARMSQSPKALRRLHREIEVLKGLDSPHVARFLASGELPDHSPYIVMEYLEGRDLKVELRRRGRLPCAEACAYILQACRGIAVAHARQVIHRDLKPSNLVITNLAGMRTVKVVDFGVAKVLRHADQTRTPSSDAIVGTPLYMAPEQLMRHVESTPRLDLWALGVMLYEILTGVPPFADDTPGAVVAAVTLDEPEPIEQIVPELPVGLGELVMQLMQKDPNARPESIAQLAERLTPFATPDAELMIPDEPVDPERLVAVRRRRPKRPNPWAPQPRRIRSSLAPADDAVTVRRSAPAYARLASMKPKGNANCDDPTVALDQDADVAEPQRPAGKA